MRGRITRQLDLVTECVKVRSGFKARPIDRDVKDRPKSLVERADQLRQLGRDARSVRPPRPVDQIVGFGGECESNR